MPVILQVGKECIEFQQRRQATSCVKWSQKKSFVWKRLRGWKGGVNIKEMVK